jgi:hypothetical protein
MLDFGSMEGEDKRGILAKMAQMVGIGAGYTGFALD